MEGVAEKAFELNAEKVVIVDRWKGGPGKIQLFKIGEKGLKAVSPLIYLADVKFRRDFGKTAPRWRRIKSLAIAHSTKASLDVKKFENALSQFFAVPIIGETNKEEYNTLMQISTNTANHIIVTFKLVPEYVEVGPRLRISHLIWS